MTNDTTQRLARTTRTYLRAMVMTLVVTTSITVLTGATCAMSGLFPTGGGSGSGGGNSTAGATPGVLSVQVATDSLAPAGYAVPSAQSVPDDRDVNLTPTAYSIAFKRIVLKVIDPVTNEASSEVEIFNTDNVDDALILDLNNDSPESLLDVETLTSGTYSKADIEVFYLDMTVPTLYPGTTSRDIKYRMVFEEIGTLQPRDFLLYLEPEWFENNTQLGMTVTEAGWYWMDRGDSDNVVAVEGATEHPTFPVLDLFSNDEFWNAEHKVLEGGVISPALEFNAETGGLLTMQFDVTEKFNFKDYYDNNTEADGLWEIRRDGGIHPFPPDIECMPSGEASLITNSGDDNDGDSGDDDSDGDDDNSNSGGSLSGNAS